MLCVVNMHIVNQMVQMPIVYVKKVGHIIQKILLLVALKSMNVTLLENVLVLQALLVRLHFHIRMFQNVHDFFYIHRKSIYRVS